MKMLEVILVGQAAVTGGEIKALTGGGTLITFPMLTSIGIPPWLPISPIPWPCAPATWEDFCPVA